MHNKYELLLGWRPSLLGCSLICPDEVMWVCLDSTDSTDPSVSRSPRGQSAFRSRVHPSASTGGTSEAEASVGLQANAGGEEGSVFSETGGLQVLVQPSASESTRDG